jgi:MFS transporter, FHS family, glucose/mannose:H+ symporter
MIADPRQREVAGNAAHPSPPSSHRHLAVFWLYAGFLFTGAMTVLLGLMLPRVAALHRLTDRQSGVLLFTQFAASASGALLVRRRFERTVSRGYALLGAGALVLLFAPSVLAVPAVAVFGLGLGMAMTSTTMQLGRLFPRARGSVLSLLNFSWSVGATLCPVLVARVPGAFSLALVCVPVALLSAALALATRLSALPGPADRPVSARPEPETRWSIVVLFAAIGFLYVGTETTIGSWMSAFASRAVAWNFGRANLAAACFWGALLLGRAAAPLVLRFLTELRCYLLSIAGVFAGILLLVEARIPAMLLAGACCAGLMLAPIYPLTIALFLERAGDSRNAGWVFAVSGFGGAILPWITGFVSAATGSLRSGLMITLAADLGILLLSLFIVRAPRRAPRNATPAGA